MGVCYVNFSLENPRDQITIRGLKENGVQVFTISNRERGLGKYLSIAREFLSQKAQCDTVIIGFAGSLLVPLVYLLTRKTIVYNTLGSFTDSMVLSRHGGARSLASAWYFIIDFVAFHLADHVFVESEAQKKYVAQHFFRDPNAISAHYLGTNEHDFFVDSSVEKCEQFTVVFRGMFLPEAGVDVAIRAAKELEDEDIAVRIIGRGLLLPEIKALVAELAPRNLEFITERLPIGVLRRRMLECHASLGQLANHPRLDRTIPHKAYESMAMKLPYITAANKAVFEILKPEATCFSFAPGDYKALAEKIRALQNQRNDISRVAENAFELYKHSFTSKMLAQKMLRALHLSY